MKIFFSIRHPGVLRNFASTIAELAGRGHHLHLSFMTKDKRGDTRILRELATAHPAAITYGWHRIIAQRSPWLRRARALGRARDYVRYHAPEFAAAHALRTRAARDVPASFRRALEWPLVRTRPGLGAVRASLAAFERRIPADPDVTALIAAKKPDVMLLTPLIELDSDQIEYLRAARALGIPAGVCVHSWDNLTNKGVIRIKPDRVFVWNDAQKREAVSLHGVDADRVVVTGAPVFDQWFGRTPATDREAFCRKAGLPAARPFFLYLCSSTFIARDEAAFVRRWAEAVRTAPDARVRTAGILIRPHPRSHASQWESFGEMQNAAIWPRAGANPVDVESKQDYFDSMYHSAAAVGINTTAQIEAAIVGRPVYSLRVPEYAATQEGTLHFHYLLKEGGGLLHMADSLDEHARMLSSALDDGDSEAVRLREFVRAFVRPKGLDSRATPQLADAIEALGRVRSAAPAMAAVIARTAS